MEPEEYKLISAVEESHWWYKGLRNHVLRKLGGRIDASSRILDAGCGTGGIVAAMKGRFPESKIVGVDISPVAMTLATEGASGRIALGEVDSLPFLDSSFDVIVSFDVLCNAAVDEQKAIQELMRVTQPGGLVLIQVPAYEWLRSDHDIVVHTARRYTAGMLRSSFSEAGFGVVECGYRNSLLFPLMVAQRLLNKARKSRTPRSAVVRHGNVINALLGFTLAAESMLLRYGVRFPGGGSVFAIFRKANS